MTEAKKKSAMKKKGRIHASQFYNYVQCPARVYLNIYGDKSRKLPFSEFMQQKMEEGLVHEKEVISDKDFVEVKAETDEEAAAATEQMMHDGVDIIYQGVLYRDSMIGRPDLLIKKKGKSELGDWHYMACDIKSGKHLKEEYRMQVTFYSHMLEIIQGRLPTTGQIINSQKEELDFSVKEEMDRFYEILREVRAISEGKVVEPSVYSRCSECVWREYCYAYAEEKQDISLIYKLNRQHKEILNAKGIKTIKQAAALDVSALSRVKGLTEPTLSRLKLQAQSLLDKKTIVVHKPRIDAVDFELFFDIEGETELGIDYLYGVLVRDCRAECEEAEEFHAFWADVPEDEEKMWKEFCSFMSDLASRGSFKVYHYTHYELTSMKRLREKYGMPRGLFDKISRNMVDLFKVITKDVVVPLYSYSIKPIAKMLNFSWKADDAGGAQSMVWYHEWLDKKDAGLREKIIEYNRDDCEATRVVLDWLKGLEK
ncbi:TM0106 family RecB-like putative nuclease [Candidatus Woesearchaeota archaeon]|nr:TM0106 family RecB-like putative nuclease [Candidatus Woesearchaeota archaeon]